MTPQATPTMEKFGFPATLVGETKWWAIQFRRKQVTLGSLVLAAKHPVTAFSALPGDAFADLARAISAIECALGEFTAYERINYLMLMMVDPHPHFHVIPRYGAQRDWRSLSFPDAGWPGPPALDHVVEMPADTEAAAIAELRTLFTKAGA